MLRSNTHERPGRRSAALGYYPYFLIIPIGCAVPYGGSWLIGPGRSHVPRTSPVWNSANFRFTEF